MKKEDLCMLLLVVALLLIISRSTNIFEGVDETLDEIVNEEPEVVEEEPEVVEEEPEVVPTPSPLPTPNGVKPEGVDVVPPPPGSGKIPPTPQVNGAGANGELPPTPAVAPTPPPATPPPATPPTPPATPPTPPATPPTPASPPSTPPVAPSPTNNNKKVTFGEPLVDQSKGAFGEGWVNAFDSETDIYAITGGDENYGEKIPLSLQQEYLTMKSLGTLTPEIMKNLDEKRSDAHLLGTDFKPWDPSSTSGALLENQFKGVQIDNKPATTNGGVVNTPPPTGGGSIEVHMVYGDWCGHSQKAKPAFESLVKDTTVKTAGGSSVNFVMTKDDSPAMEQFKQTVRGFPSYMVVKADKTMEKLTGHDRSSEGIKAAVEKLNY